MTLQAAILVPEGKLGLIIDELRAIGGDIDRAFSAAISNTTRKARVRTVRAVAKDLRIAQKDLYQRGASGRPITERVERGAGGLVHEGHVGVTGRRIPLSRFSPRQIYGRRGRQNAGSGESNNTNTAEKTRGRRRPGLTRRPGRRANWAASYRIGSRSRRRVNQLFVIRFKSGHTKVYRRVGKGREVWKDGVAEERFGPSVPHVAERHPDVRNIVEGQGAETFVQEMNSQVDRFVGRGRSRA